MCQTSTILALSALIVSIVSLGLSAYFTWLERDHNRRSLRPLPFILQPDFEDKVAVVIRNNGTGPLILKKAHATSSADRRSGHLIDLVPTPPKGMVFRNFNRIDQTRAVRPGDEVDLLDLRINVNDPVAARYRDELRRVLGNVTLELTYTDVYCTRFPVYSRTLDWFLRHSGQPEAPGSESSK